MSTTPETESESAAPRLLEGKWVAFAGKLGGVSRREAAHYVRLHGGAAVDRGDRRVNLVVVGADELPLQDEDGDLLDEFVQERAADARLEIISETQFWQRLGYMEADANVRRLYTPAMLAELLDVPISIIRRWSRKRLIVPAREVHRLPYFDFQEVATARSLAQLLAAGASPVAIERKLAALSRYLPEIDRPLAQLSVIVEGRQLLLRQGEGLIEPGGQLRFDFDSLESTGESTDREPLTTLSLDDVRNQMEMATPGELLQIGALAEDEGELEVATEAYRSALAIGGPCPEVVFQLAELLYRVGDVTAARERYYNVLELDESFVEARHNLGCILAETGQPELAASAFQGALSIHPDYPDAHYQLARTLDELGEGAEAAEHWRAFLKLAPTSPWAAEAKDRLGAE